MESLRADLHRDSDAKQKIETRQPGGGSIRVEQVSKWFFRRSGERLFAIKDVTIDMPAGSFTCLVGPSGSGKSTIMNCVAGLEHPDAGQVFYKGQPITGLNVGIGYMTQKDNLLPWRSVVDNVRLPLQIRGVKADEARAQALEVIRRVGLAGFETHRPTELSGGMQKRTALARTLVFNPDTLLMDEPFGNLDAQLKVQLQAELLSLWDRDRKTVVFVTHDLEEAIALADQVVVLSGRPGQVIEVIQVDLPRPRDPRVLRFEAAFQQLHRRLWNLIEAPNDEGYHGTDSTTDR